jgi:prepilin-type N-terminal cleavage/methylation domain-containing protein/prepilin-type processing-associated H-X9-DG protein
MKPTRPRRCDAFTLIELLVVLGIVAVLLALLLPAMNLAKVRVQRAACLSNLRQLGMASFNYVSDNSGELPVNFPLLAPRQPNPADWFLGFAGSPHDPMYGPAPQYACTNVNLARASKLFSYHQSVEISRCPADMRDLGGLPFVRSFSLNCWMNGRTVGDPSGQTVTALDSPLADSGLVMRFFRNESQFARPASLWNLIDEDAETINDSMFIVDLSVKSELADKPARRHAGAYSISFADGHAELFRLSGFGASRLKMDQAPATLADPDWANLSRLTTSPNL